MQRVPLAQPPRHPRAAHRPQLRRRHPRPVRLPRHPQRIARRARRVATRHAATPPPHRRHHRAVGAGLPAAARPRHGGRRRSPLRPL
ncbi:hypothetical protein EKG83_26950 [Saccharothrix syringae]|uniref:Uncharacterized protein n=1 Tax=Saccharothrix syringae TaxID=103733 RepID=A0A5Q0HEC4_SACSY|nr:hypothetical protein EKG83_26950 [Saccharothrix syringae]